MNNENSFSGYVKLYRSILDWGWFRDTNTLHVFVCLLALANFKDGEWLGVKLKRGQLICSRKTISGKTGLSEQSVRTAIKHLKSTNEITTSSTSKFTLVTIVNYDKYQGNGNESTSKSTSELTNDQPASNQQVTSEQPQRKNDKNEKNEKNDKNKSTPAIENESDAKQNYADNVRMTVEQYDKLVEQYSKHRTDNMIIDLSLWKSSKGKKTKCDYSTVMAWMRKEDKEKPASKFQILQMPKGEAQCN